MSVRMTAVGSARLTGDGKPFREIETFRSRKVAITFLREEFGCTEGVSDSDFLLDLKRYSNIDVTFEEI